MKFIILKLKENEIYYYNNYTTNSYCRNGSH